MTDQLASELSLKLAKRLTALRLHKTWTRDTLAKKSNVNVYTLKHFERTGQISLPRLIKLCDALGILNELQHLFMPRQRVDVDNWELPAQKMRQRGKRRTAMTNEEEATAETQAS